MSKPKPTKVATTSEPIANANLAKLRQVFPQFVKDGEIDFDALQAFFNKEGILAGEEKYGLNWSGKSNAFKAIRLPATGTLTPQPKESKDWDKTENLFIEGDNLEVWFN
jgi:adenine-specific DNA-methyltransferase